ncbi:MAG: phosphoribosyl-AMP cyclohydrolase [Deltaproteobacteria bacterium]|nr:phosphoribosyl-AMP cyclohydrolase [Deltaproteobacteria bacterium]
MSFKEIIQQLKFDDKGLIPAIMQDAENGEILMFAFMNSEAVEKTLTSGLANFYSRSRNKMWVKGESSGHTQEVKEVYFDCDKDVLLVKIKQNVAACHTGYRSCFFSRIDLQKESVETVGEKVFEEEKVYKK